MKEKNDEDDKIANFMEISQINDRELAKEYLLSANWDESKAINAYFSRVDKNQIINNPSMNSNANYNNNIIPNNNISNNNNPINNDNNEGFLSRYIFSPIMSLFSSCYSNHESEAEDDINLFRFLPNKTKDFAKFNVLIKKYLGIIIYYDRNNITFLKDIIDKICRNTTIMNILKKNCIIFPISFSSSNGHKIQDIIVDFNLICPSFFFCFNNSQENILGQNNIIETLSRENISIDKLYKTLMNLLPRINPNIKIIKNTNNNIQESSNINILTDAEILQKQKNDMEALENNVQKYEEDIQNENIKKQQQLENIEKAAEKLKKKFETEPEESNPDCCVICFRYPDGDKRKDRRFLKTDKIKILYEYVKSLGNEIYTEEGNGVFSLYQPFPPKKYENMENTLEQENLVSNAVIQIREE